MCYWQYFVYLAWITHEETNFPLPETSLIQAGVPIFFTMIIVEFLISYWRNLHLYNINDSICCISCGLYMQVMEILFDKVIAACFGVYLITGIPYKYIHDNFRIASIGGSWGFIGMILCHDLGYYWSHRAGHRIACLWAVHAVHHRSNEFNYSVALSQGALRRWAEALFYVSQKNYK